MGEQLDIVTATGEYVRSASRAEVHANALWHEVFHCLIVRSTSPARVVLQRRHRGKAAFPGLLDVSAAGHLTTGESPDDGVRELNEELGTTAVPADLVPVGIRLLADDNGEGRNRERVNLYFLCDDRPLDEFVPEPTEVESLVEVGAADLLASIALVRDGGDDASPPGPAAIEVLEWYPGSPPVAATIEAADLIEPASDYWTVLLVMAERFAAGETPIAI